MTGRQIIKVTSVKQRDFEANPNMIWDYDVMMYGTWDSNAFNLLSDNAINTISDYISKGKGVLTGHDTIGAGIGWNGMSKIASKFNIVLGVWGNSQHLGYDYNYQWFVGSDKIKVSKKGFLTQFPWNLGPVRNCIKYSIYTYSF